MSDEIRVIDLSVRVWATVRVSSGDVLACCPFCAALVTPDDQGYHTAWHAQTGTAVRP